MSQRNGGSSVNSMPILGMESCFLRGTFEVSLVFAPMLPTKVHAFPIAYLWRESEKRAAGLIIVPLRRIRSVEPRFDK